MIALSNLSKANLTIFLGNINLTKKLTNFFEKFPFYLIETKLGKAWNFF